MTASTQASDGRKVTIGIAFDPGTRALVDRLAADEERSRSQVVRRAIRVYAEQKES